MECIGCKAFYQSDIKEGESRKCFVCGIINTKSNPFIDLLSGGIKQREKRGEEFMNIFNNIINKK